MELIYDPTVGMDLPKKKRRLSIWIIISVVLAILVILLILFGQRFIDYLSGRDYEPSPEMAGIIKNLELTDDADLILRAVHPVLQNVEEFNQHCPNNDEEMSTLGCYSPGEGRIFIFNVTSEELDGIKESVLSHELLHAVYQRLNGVQRSGLNSELKAFYEAHRDEFGDYLSKYSDELFYTELHSVVGQRMSYDELSEPLRNHYAKYFKDQDVIADYYKKYRTIFDELTENIERLSKMVEDWRESVQGKRDIYQQHADSYNKIHQEYERRLTSGYFKNWDESHKAYEQVRDLWQDLEKERKLLNSDIEDLNKKIAELNEYVERSNALNSTVNSHVNTNTEQTSDAEK